MDQMGFIIIWMAVAALVAWQAQRRGYPWFLAFLGGIFLGIFALVVVFLLPDRLNKLPAPDRYPARIPEAPPQPLLPTPPTYQPAAQHIHIHQMPTPAAQPPPQQSSPAAMIPKLPAKCESCGQPLSMNNVQWSGPLNARCPACGAAVEVKWEKIGAAT